MKKKKVKRNEDEVTNMKTARQSPRLMAGPLAFLIFNFSFFITAAGAADGYKPETDTRPVKAKKGENPSADLSDEDSDKDSGPLEAPFPDPKVSFDFHDEEMICV